MFSCTFVHRPRLQFIQSLLAFECRKYNLFNRPLPECLHGTKIVHYSCLTLTSMVRKGAIKLLWLLCGILLMHSAAGIASPPSLFAGDVKGKVILRRPSRDESKIVSRSIIRRYVNKTYQRATSHDQRPAIVVYIEGFEFGRSNSNGATAVLDQVNERFVPHVLPIMVGTVVQFLNSDEVYHNVFSFSPAKSFDLGRYKRGKSRAVTFDKPGVVKVYCDIHTHMNAFVIVLQNPFFAVTDDNGNFEIKGVPPGKYTLKAWHGRWPEKSARIAIEKNGTVEITFEFP